MQAFSWDTELWGCFEGRCHGGGNGNIGTGNSSMQQYREKNAIQLKSGDCTETELDSMPYMVS